jgi:hypothetical protein
MVGLVLDDDVRHSRIWSKLSEIVERLLAQVCELCGSTDNMKFTTSANLQTWREREKWNAQTG